MSTVLITGGAGFIGSHLAERLLADGHAVRVLDNLSTGKRENVSEILDRIEFSEGDIRDEKLLAGLVDGAEIVFHLAAIPSVPESVKDPEGTHDVNVGGTLKLFSAARKAGVKRLVFASSSAVYGDSAVVPTPEDAPARPTSPYGLQKLFCEHFCRMANSLYGLETVVLRYFNVFGERQDVASQYAAAVPNFITRLLRGEPPEIYGDGGQTRDFIYVGNAAEAAVLAAVHPDAPGNVFNIAGGEATTVNELASACAKAVGKDIKPVHVAERMGDIRFSAAAVSRAKSVLGFTPAVTFEDGLTRTAEFFRKA